MTRPTCRRCCSADGGEALLAAISCGAVMMGCLTYIGNGPNLMVKEIAEARGVRMPHFLGYAAAAAVVMLPVFVAVTFLFFLPRAGRHPPLTGPGARVGPMPPGTRSVIGRAGR